MAQYFPEHSVQNIAGTTANKLRKARRE